MVQGCDCKLNRREAISAKFRPPLLLCAARSERIPIRAIVLTFARNSLGTDASRGYFTKKVRPGLVLRIFRKVHSAKLRDLCFSLTKRSQAELACSQISFTRMTLKQFSDCLCHIDQKISDVRVGATCGSWDRNLRPQKSADGSPPARENWIIILKIFHSSSRVLQGFLCALYRIPQAVARLNGDKKKIVAVRT